MKTWIRMLAIGLLVFPATLGAESTPEAKKWLKNMTDLYEKAPLTADLEATFAAVANMPVGGTIQGKMTLKDRTHQRVEMEMDMSGAGGQGGMRLKMLQVTDGTHAWTEMDMGIGKQVIKLALEDMEKMAQAQGLAPGMGSMDPVAQVEQLSKTMDFEVVGNEAGKVTLRAKMTDETRKAMGSVPVQGLDTMTLVLDEKTSFPLELMLGDEKQPFVTMQFKNLAFVKASELPAGAFSYTPPEGVPVIDAAQMMGAAAGQGGGR